MHARFRKMKKWEKRKLFIMFSKQRASAMQCLVVVGNCWSKMINFFHVTRCRRKNKVDINWECFCLSSSFQSFFLHQYYYWKERKSNGKVNEKLICLPSHELIWWKWLMVEYILVLVLHFPCRLHALHSSRSKGYQEGLTCCCCCWRCFVHTIVAAAVVTLWEGGRVVQEKPWINFRYFIWLTGYYWI